MPAQDRRLLKFSTSISFANGEPMFRLELGGPNPAPPTRQQWHGGPQANSTRPSKRTQQQFDGHEHEQIGSQRPGTSLSWDTIPAARRARREAGERLYGRRDHSSRRRPDPASAGSPRETSGIEPKISGSLISGGWGCLWSPTSWKAPSSTRSRPKNPNSLVPQRRVSPLRSAPRNVHGGRVEYLGLQNRAPAAAIGSSDERFESGQFRNSPQVEGERQSLTRRHNPARR